MSMGDAIWWFGLAHIVAYSLAAGSALMIWTLNVTYRRLGIGGKVLRAHLHLIRNRRAILNQDTDHD